MIVMCAISYPKEKEREGERYKEYAVEERTEEEREDRGKCTQLCDSIHSDQALTSEGTEGEGEQEESQQPPPRNEKERKENALLPST
jgi:hypothetical protein